MGKVTIGNGEIASIPMYSWDPLKWDPRKKPFSTAGGLHCSTATGDLDRHDSLGWTQRGDWFFSPDGYKVCTALYQLLNVIHNSREVCLVEPNYFKGKQWYQEFFSWLLKQFPGVCDAAKCYVINIPTSSSQDIEVLDTVFSTVKGTAFQEGMVEQISEDEKKFKSSAFYLGAKALTAPVIAVAATIGVVALAKIIPSKRTRTRSQSTEIALT